ncbi:DUF1302 domain-containing protein [Pelomonas sp. KK5]|uniref:DUF1302 domain-containing protein n=1 Tax=Pelomonas sp. KK5 TaxID=1855730 RepID=UPI00097BD3F8|nr:DUF1302 family protein [Pelomonas sp. KK5]
MKTEATHPGSHRRPHRRSRRTLIGAAGLLIWPAAHADEAPAPPIELNWNTSVKYASAYRLKDRDQRLISGGSSAAADDGDRNFAKGFVSQRFDVFSEVDLRMGNGGVRASGAAWYDAVYNRSNDNDSPATSQGAGPARNEFNRDTARLHGRKAELLDAFGFYSGDVGGHDVSVRLGRHAQVWGESLFYGNNGIAYAMVPIDVIKASSVPGTQFRELIRPVNQISGQINLSPSVVLGAYYQFSWEKTRLAGAGSYLSPADMLDAGGQQLMVIPAFTSNGFSYPGFAAQRTADDRPGNGGQGGLQLRFSVADWGTDFGLYAVRYDERVPQLILQTLGPTGLRAPSPAMAPSSYHLYYGRGARAFGASFSQGLGESSVGGEVSIRDGATLVNDPVQAFAGRAPARGRSLHVNLSTLTSFEPNWLSQESSLAGELACNRTLSVSNGQAVAANSTRDACGVRVVYELKYRQIAPGLDVALPLSVSTTHGASSAVVNFGADRSGDVSLTANFNYLDKWRFGLGYTHFYGPVGTPLDAHGQNFSFRQALADRDFLSLTLATTF